MNIIARNVQRGDSITTAGGWRTVEWVKIEPRLVTIAVAGGEQIKVHPKRLVEVVR